MSSFSVGGLASGLDTKSIISQLLEIESRPKTRKEWSKSLWTERKNNWTDLNAKLLALQGKANVLNNPSTWNVASGITSSDPTKLTGSAGGPAPAAGVYSLNITQLAATERWNAANNVSAATGGVRQSGTWYSGPFTEATSGTLLTGLKTAGGVSLGLDVGSTISMSATVNGAPVNANYVVGAGSTLDNLTQWAESNFPGATFTVNGDGTLTYQSAAGLTNEITALSFTAVNSGAAPLPFFNASTGAASAFVAPASGGGAADTLTITQGASVWNVAIGAGANEAAIMAAINGTGGIGVTASIVAGKLQIDANPDMGASGSFTVTSAGTLATDLGMAETIAGQDSIFDVDGTGYTRTKNLDIDDVITDVDLDLIALTAGPVTLTVTAGGGTASPADIKKKITEFVDQYNAVIDLVNAKTAELKVANPKNLSEFIKGPMSRDYRFASVGFELRRWATDTISALPDTANALDDIGITTGPLSTSFSQQNVAGRLYIDEAKLDAAIAADPASVQTLFTQVGGAAGHQDDGIARRVSALVSGWRVGGVVDAAMQGATRQISEIQRTIDRLDERLTRKQTYYEKMFSSLESTLGKLQSQNAWVTGQFAQLMNGGGN